MNDSITARKRMSGARGAGRLLTGLGAMGMLTSTSAVTAAPVAAGPSTEHRVSRAASAAPVGSVFINNVRLGTLAAGGVGTSGKGKVFTAAIRGSVPGEQARQQQWNHVNGGKLINRQLVRGVTFCADASRDVLFITRCTDRLSQKWAFKIALDKPGTAADTFRVQNFATSQCMQPILPANPVTGEARVGMTDCKAGVQLQQWFVTPSVRA